LPSPSKTTRRFSAIFSNSTGSTTTVIPPACCTFASPTLFTLPSAATPGSTFCVSISSVSAAFTCSFALALSSAVCPCTSSSNTSLACSLSVFFCASAAPISSGTNQIFENRMPRVYSGRVQLASAILNL